MLNPFCGSFQTFLQPFFCLSCGTLQYRSLCAFCRAQWQAPKTPFDSVIDSTSLYALWFGNAITYRAFRQWKLTGSPRIANLLFQIEPQLFGRMKEESIQGVIAIPQDPKRSWNRGFESAQVAAEIFSDALQVPLYPVLDLIKMPQTRQQAMKDRLDRTLSANPFQLKTNHRLPSNILVVDDVVTTGTTLQHAVDTLSGSMGVKKTVAGALVYKPGTTVRKKRLANYSSLARSSSAPDFK